MDRKQRSTTSKANGKAKAKKTSESPSRKQKARSNGPSVRTRQVGAAVASHAARIGMSDLIAHRISWIAGYTYVGDGTLGATDSVYFRPAGATTDVTTGATGAGMVPFLSTDAQIGQTYLADVEKHFARKRVRRAAVRLVSLQPSTANSCMVQVAPVRGPGASGDTNPLTASIVAAPVLANVMGMSGSKSVASWEHATIDMTPFIAGGSGATQDEFSIAATDGDSAWGSGAIDVSGIAPCAFVITGQNSTAALRGTNVHAVILEETVDLLDFIGGQSIPFPIGFSVETLGAFLAKSKLTVPKNVLEALVPTIQRAARREVEERSSTLSHIVL